MIDLSIGSYFLWTALVLCRHIRSVSAQLGLAPERKEFVDRMTFYVIAFGLLLLTKVVTMLLSGVMHWWVYPSTWKYSMAAVSLAHSGRCFCRAQLLRSKRPPSSSSVRLTTKPAVAMSNLASSGNVKIDTENA